MLNYFEFVDQLPVDVAQKMERNVVAYETACGTTVNYKRFSIILRDSQKELVGALNAYTAYAEIYIDDIWVDSTHRKKGYGRKLIQKLEDHFKNKGYNNINLVTSAFQAPDFYKNCGFQVEFVRQNMKHPKLTKTFFVKFFDDKEQTQGILKPI